MSDNEYYVKFRLHQYYQSLSRLGITSKGSET